MEFITQILFNISLHISVKQYWNDWHHRADIEPSAAALTSCNVERYTFAFL